MSSLHDSVVMDDPAATHVDALRDAQLSAQPATSSYEQDESTRELAPALSSEVMNEWKMLRFPGLTAEEERRAQCAAQPTITDCLVDEAGRPRGRPPVLVPDPEDREPNDYDHLLDLRVHSPNGRPVGFWDFDPDEIERENCFTPMCCGTPENPTPSPGPEDGSLEQRMYTMDGDAPQPTQWETFLAATDRHACPLNQHDTACFVTGFRALPYHLQCRVILEGRLGWYEWEEALQKAEKRHRLGKLTRGQKEIYAEVSELLCTARRLLPQLKEEGEKLKQDMIEEVRAAWPIHESPAAAHVLRGLYQDGEEVCPGIINNEPPLRGAPFWNIVIDTIDEGLLSGTLRKCAVQRYFNYYRTAIVSACRQCIRAWLDAAGNSEEEMEGIISPGDFWHIPIWWKYVLERMETFCVVSDEEAEKLDLDKINRMINSTKLGHAASKTAMDEAGIAPRFWTRWAHVENME